MKILGISDSKTESGICFYKDGKLEFALNEERVTRKKIDGSFPYRSLETFYNLYADELNSIDYIAVGGIYTPTPVSRFFSFLVDVDKSSTSSGNTGSAKLFRYIEYLVTYRFKLLASVRYKKRKNRLMISMLKRTLRKKLHPSLRAKHMYLVDHHQCHAAAAFFSSGFKESLVASFDGFGDGASAKIYVAKDDDIRQVMSIPALDSFGLYYSLITEVLGFTPEKHEGKVTGLAAFGDHRKIRERFPFTLSLRKRPRYEGRGGIVGLKDVRRQFLHYDKKDVAAWLQHNTEKMVCDIVSHHMRKHKQKNLCLVGGLTANVKLNQRLHELKETKNIYIYPAMSDMGISHGAVLALERFPEVMEHAYYGTSYSEAQIESVLRREGLRFKRYKDIEKKIARLLSEGKIVARFNGRMEYGPRALGNRSILVQATDKSINDSLNRKLKRTEFMPFAPTILDGHERKCLKGIDGAELTSRFMNISFPVKPFMRKNCPAAVHVDDTARPQVIRKEDNLSYYRVLDEYRKITGLPAILNTSFNVHEEPIVMTPEDAIKGFMKASLDYLAIGDFLVEGHHDT